MKSLTVFRWVVLFIALNSLNCLSFLKQTSHQFAKISRFLKQNELFPHRTNAVVGIFLLNNLSTEANDIITDWLPATEYPKFSGIKIMTKVPKKSKAAPFANTIVFLDSIDRNINLTLAPLLEELDLWKIESRFVFVLTRVFDEGPDTLKFYLKLFWRKVGLIHFIVICMDSLNMLQVLSYHPFKDAIQNFTMTGNYTPAALFSNKARNLYGYTLNISYLFAVPYVYKRDEKIVGKDYDFTMSFVKAINASVRETVRTIFDEVVADVTYGSSDLGAQSIFMLENTIGRVAYPHGFTDVVALVKSAEPVPAVAMLIYIFDLYTWLSIISFLIIFYSLKWLWSKKIYATSSRSNKEFSLRLLICAFAVFNIIMTQTFQSWIITFLIYPKRVKDIDTVDELVESKMPVYSLVQWKDFLTIKLRDQYVFLNETNIATEAKGGAFVTTYDFLKNIPPDKQDGSVHQVQENIGTAVMMFYLGVRSPYREVLRDMTLRSLAYGYYSKEWGRAVLPPATTRNFKKLELVHLKGVFFIWGVGIGLSILAFIIEVLWHRYYRTSKLLEFTN